MTFDQLVQHHRALYNDGRSDAMNLTPTRGNGGTSPWERNIGRLGKAERASYWLGFSQDRRLSPRHQAPLDTRRAPM